MFISIILFCLYFTVQGQNLYSNDLKYIDLLPEKEKKEFVERVARRILSEVKPVGVPKEESILITDEELNKTSEYVNKVVKEESINFENIRQHNVSDKNDTAIERIDDVQKYETTTSENPTNIEHVQDVYTKTGKSSKVYKNNSDLIQFTSENYEQTAESATMEPENLNLRESKNASEDVLRSDRHIDLTLRRGKMRLRRNSDESDKNEESHLDDPKYDIYEQGSVKSFNNITSKKADGYQLNVSSTTQITETKVTLDNFTSSNGYEITDSLTANPNVTISNVLVKRQKDNDSDLVQATNTEESSTILFEHTTEEQVKKDSRILVESTEELLAAKINNNDTFSHQNESSIKSIMPSDIRRNNTQSLRSLDSESFITITENNDSSKINKEITTEKEAQSVKDDTSYLKILNTKYVETLPPDFGNVEVQIPKPDENNNNKLRPSRQSVRTYDVFEVEPDKSVALLLHSDDTNKDNEVTDIGTPIPEKPRYVPVHDYASENVFYNAHNNLGPNSDDPKNTVFEAAPGGPLFSLKSPDRTEDEPHYAPVYDHVPENFYHNFRHQYDPSDEDEEQAESFESRRGNDRMEEISYRNGAVDNINEDYYSLRSGKANYNVNRKFDFRIKKPTGHHKLKQALVGVLDQSKKSGTVSPDDYFDLDYFFGRSQTNNDNIRYEPSKSGGTKSNLKAILKRNRTESRDDLISTILKQLTMEAKVSRSGQGFAADYYWSRMASGSTEIQNRLPVFRSKKKKEIDIKNVLRNNFDEANALLMDETETDNYNWVDYEEVPTLKKHDDNGNHTENKNIDDNDTTTEKVQDNNDVGTKMSNEHDNIKAKKCKNNNATDDEITKNSVENDNNSKLGKKGKGELNLNYNMTLNIEAKINKFLRSLDSNFVIEPYVTALENLIKNNSEGLRKYDWLGTTVDLQAALDKLINLADSDPNEDIHPNDKAILNYIQLLYDSAQEVQSADLSLQAYLRANTRRGILPRSKIKSKARRNAIKMLQEFHRILRDVFKDNENGDQQAVVLHDEERDNEGDEKGELLHFFVDLRSSLNQFHNALKHISLVTKYKTQKWYENIKQLYLERPKRKQLLEVLLHLFSIRLFGLIEESAKNGLEKDYISYVLEHKEEVRRTKDELVFVIKLVNEIKRIDAVD